MNIHLYNQKVQRQLKYLAAVLIAFCSIKNSFAQNTPVDLALKNDYALYSGKYVQEKIFVHTNKDYFVSGEILWFRVFYVDALSQKPITLSKIGYIELLDQNNHPVLQQKISLKPAESHGSLIIPHTVPSGIYRFRAYTNWMKNFGPDLYFEKTIRIVNTKNLEPDSTIGKTKLYDVQFFPEGGNLVQGIESRVAFRVTDSYGRGQMFNGTLIGSDHDTILKFHPAQMGIGHFDFLPAAGENYKAVINFPNGDQFVKELPVSFAGGYVMHLSKQPGGQISIRVRISPGIRDQKLYLFIHNHSAAGVNLIADILNSTASFDLKSDVFGDGISQCTVFNEMGEPVCERLYFKYPEKKLLINADFSADYGLRKKVDLTITTLDQSGKQLNADMSMAVYRIDSLQNLDETDIKNYFYLESELGNSIESPSFYFKDNRNGQLEAMDNLMLTQGWRRFRWKDWQHRQQPQIIFSPEFNGHVIQGRMVNNQTGRGVPLIDTYLSVPSNRTQFRSTISDSNGYVKFEMTGFYGSQEIIVQRDQKDDSSCHFEIVSPFSNQYSKTALPAFSVPSINSTTLLDEVVHQQVQRVYDGANMSKFNLQAVDTNPFYVVPDEKYLLDDYTRFITMEEVLREYVHSINVTRRKEKLVLYAFDNYHKTFFSGYPLILIDGVPFFDPSELFLQDPSKIRQLDLVNKDYALGYKTYEGILNLKTYRGDLDGIIMNPHATAFDYPCIPEEREFYSPVYQTELQVNSRIPDYRTALYWSPQVKSVNSEKNQLSFYTSDIPGKYAVVIQGLSESGEPGSRIGFFEVKK
jgi:hypothetical protein